MPANPLLKELRTHLTALYPDPADARRVVDDAGVTQAQIDFSGKAINNWHAILTEAEKQGQLAAIIEVALEEYPQHAALARLYTALGRTQSETGAGEPGLSQHWGWGLYRRQRQYRRGGFCGSR